VFNLLVKYTSWADGRDTMPQARAFEYTSEELAIRFCPGAQHDFPALAALPTLFVQETSGLGEQVAHVGTITRARLNGRDIVLEFTYDLGIAAIPNHVLLRSAVELDIDKYEFSRTHWAIKDVDLYRTLLRNSHPRRQRPRVFQLTEYENIEPSLLSVMMPFHPDFAVVYEALERAASTVGLRCRKADDIWENPAVMQDVVSLIDRSKIIICDCTGRNPNVFYEIGIAHALGREVILITQSDADIPFDLRHLRYITYRNSAEALDALNARLVPHLRELML
jgi:hypothetical protein